MNNITWLSHGGPGSGRYPKGSGKKNKFRAFGNGLFNGSTKSYEEYIKSKEFETGNYNAYRKRKVSEQFPNVPKLKSGSIKPETKDKSNKTETKDKSNKTETKDKKKEYSKPSVKKEWDQKKATDAIKNDTEYRKAVAENEQLRNPKITSADLASAAGKFKGAGAMTDQISKGVDKAWNSLHDAKYSREDRSKNVSNLTNAELRNAIERIKLNQEYNKVTMPSKSKGYDRTMAALAILGSAATITATGLTIASGIQSLRKK